MLPALSTNLSWPKGGEWENQWHIKMSHQNISSKCLIKISHQKFSSKCFIKMYHKKSHQNVSSKCQRSSKVITIHYRSLELFKGNQYVSKNVLSKCLIKLFHQNVLSKWCLKMSPQNVSSKCLLKCLLIMSSQNVSSNISLKWLIKCLIKISHQHVSSICLIKWFDQNVSSKYLKGICRTAPSIPGL